jgi:hypothetical protein
MASLPLHLSRSPVAVILPFLLTESFPRVFRIEVAALHKDLAKALAFAGAATTYAAAVDAALSAFVARFSLFFTDLCAGQVTDPFVGGSKADLSTFRARLLQSMRPLAVFSPSSKVAFAAGFCAETAKQVAAIRASVVSSGPTLVTTFFTDLSALFSDAFAVSLGTSSFTVLRAELVFFVETSLRQPLVFGNSLHTGLDSLLGFRDRVAYSKCLHPDLLDDAAAKDGDAGVYDRLASCLRLGTLPLPVVAALEHSFDQRLLMASFTTPEPDLATNRTVQWKAIATLVCGPRQQFAEVWTRLLTSIAPVLARLPKVAQLTTAPSNGPEPSATPPLTPLLCHRCGASGHRTTSCTAAAVVFAPTGPCRDRRCNGAKHWLVDCPNKSL